MEQQVGTFLYFWAAAMSLVASVVSMWRWFRFTKQEPQIFVSFGNLINTTALLMLYDHIEAFKQMGYHGAHGIATSFFSLGYTFIAAGQLIYALRMAGRVELRRWKLR